MIRRALLTTSSSVISFSKGNRTLHFYSRSSWMGAVVVQLANSNLARSINCNSPVRFSGNINIDENSLKTQAAVEDFLGQLSMEQKTLLFSQLNLNILAHKCEHGESGYEIHHYLSKFGRPSTYVEGVDDSVDSRRNEPIANKTQNQTPASGRDIYAVGIKNALPFVGFGFLDNLIMIIAGDYIDITFSTVLGISTMAAAALGNTISDVAGIASAWYVEHFAEKFGIHTPKLSPFQANSWQIRWSINGGRAIGVTVGCLLGMIPLLFLPFSGKPEKDGDGERKSED